MSEFKIRKLTDRAGTGAPNFTHGFNINGSDSGLLGVTHTTGSSAPDSPSNADTWWDTGNDKYYVYVDDTWREYSIPVVAVFWYGDRQHRTGFTNVANDIHYNAIPTLGNAADFGDLSVTRTRTAACSNATYSFRFGGSNSSVSTASLTLYNVADYFACATLGNASDFGDSTASHTDGSAHSDGTTGVVWHGMNGSAGNASSISNTIDKYTLNSASNATDFGDTTTTTNRWNITESGGGNGTRGVWMGGTAAVSPYSSTTNVIDYITVATPGNATDFGDLVTARYVGTVAGAGTDDRALYFGGYTGSAGTRQIDYITVSTTGNASDFGDLSSAISTPYSGSAAANATRAVYLAAYTNNVMEYVTMSTTGNAADFGDQLGTTNTFSTSSSGAAS